jgi:hypothetical protein
MSFTSVPCYFTELLGFNDIGTLFLNTVNLFSSTTVRDQAFHPYSNKYNHYFMYSVISVLKKGWKNKKTLQFLGLFCP